MGIETVGQLREEVNTEVRNHFSHIEDELLREALISAAMHGADLAVVTLIQRPTGNSSKQETRH